MRGVDLDCWEARPGKFNQDLIVKTARLFLSEPVVLPRLDVSVSPHLFL